MGLSRVATPAVVGALEAALAAEKQAGRGEALLSFDADGTLWTGDVGHDLFEAALEHGAFREAARGALAAEARAIGLSGEGDANALAHSLYRAYEADRWPLERAFSAMAWAFAGYSTSEIEGFAREVAVARHLEDRVRASLGPVREWAASLRLEVFIVSASPIAIVRFGASLLGVGPDHVIAMNPAVSPAGVLEPRLDGPVVYGDGKFEALRARRPSAVILGAFGDSAYDAPMLRAARVKVTVAPSPGLLALADTLEGGLLLPE